MLKHQIDLCSMHQRVDFLSTTYERRMYE